MSAAHRLRGMAAVESLLALPVLLFVGLAAVQFALVHQARQALAFALHEGARAGSVAHADPSAVRAGFARGLAPWLGGASDRLGHVESQARALAHVSIAEAAGWLVIERVSPTPASFDDWAEPALDAGGLPIAGLREIPNDGLVHRATRQAPAGGAAGDRDGEPIGAASGQTLADANLLRLRVAYGVPLSVPFAGRLIAWALRGWHGCAAGERRRLGPVDLGIASPGPTADLLACTMLGIADRDPSAPPRLPIVLAATIRMQSPAREFAVATPPVPAPPPGPATGRAAPV